MLQQNGIGQCVVDCTDIEGGLYVNFEDKILGIYECRCKAGYKMDGDGFCKSCEDLVGWGCDTCNPPATSTDKYECTSCKYSYLMLNEEGQGNKCVHKLNNCEVPLHLQTVDTFDLDDEDNPICEQCLEGYFW